MLREQIEWMMKDATWLVEDLRDDLQLYWIIIKKTEYKKIAYVTDCWTYLSGYRTCCRRLF